MKRLFKTLLALLITVGFLNAEPLEQMGQKDGYDVKLTSEKSLIVGNNEIFVELSKDGKAVTTAKVKVKFFMPEMPGMPYMEYEDKATLVDGKYKMNASPSFRPSEIFPDNLCYEFEYFLNHIYLVNNLYLLIVTLIVFKWLYFSHFDTT